MTESQTGDMGRLARAALSGGLTRRQVLERGLALGLATPFLTALIAATPETSAAPTSARVTSLPLPQEGDSGTFVALITSGTEDVDPHSTYSTIGSNICLGCYEMLVQYKGESISEIEPMLALSWEASEDNSTFTFTLPADVKFHDGSTCDADAVKASFTRFLEMELGPVNVISRFIDSADKIEVMDPVTVRFNCGTPQPLFLAAMASSYGPYVVSPTAVEENKSDDDQFAHEWFTANAVGTGPYILTENNLSERIILDKFDGYHGGWDGNHFSSYVLRVVPESAVRRQLIEQGEADATTQNLTPEDVEALKSAADLSVLQYGSTQVSWTIMNTAQLNVQARQGMSYAFPYDDVIEGVFRGLYKQSGPLAESVRGFDPEIFIYKTDLDKARELLAAAGIEEGASFTIVCDSGSEEEKSLAVLFQGNLAELGYNLEIEELDLATIENIIFGDQAVEEKPTFMNWAWWPDYNDPWNQLAPNFLESSIGSGGSNPGGYVNARFEEIMAEAETYTDENRLVELMKEAQNILTEQDPPVIYWGETQYYTVIKKDIQGFYANPLYLQAYPYYRMSRGS